MSTLVTGAAGFIGSNLVHALRAQNADEHIVSFDALTYAGNLENLAALRDDPHHTFVHADITDADAVARAFAEHDVTRVFHLAAESHVDRSIDEPLAFVRTNVDGTAVLLQQAQRAWAERDNVRFLHVSTDEVFGTLGETGTFSETTPYAPRSPYAASKASSDHLVRAWHETYGFPAVITNCTNNYGPYQFPEKLIPLVICRALEQRAVPVYGTGNNVRDWLFVTDHCRALMDVMNKGEVGQTYCIGGRTEMTNLDLVGALLDEVDAQLGRNAGESRGRIEFVKDRPGHDFRYAMDCSYIEQQLGWCPSVTLAEGLAQTVAWYLAHQQWLGRVQKGEHIAFQQRWYDEDRAGGAT